MSRNGPPKTLPELLSAYERLIIIEAIVRNGFSRTQTALALGITRKDLYRRMGRLKIDLVAVTEGKSGRDKGAPKVSIKRQVTSDVGSKSE